MQEGTRGVPTHRLSPLRGPLAWVTRLVPPPPTLTGSPRRSCPGASGGGGGCWTEPGAAGKGSGRLEHPPLPAAVVFPPPRGPRSPGPAGRRAGEEENQPTEGPRSSREPPGPERVPAAPVTMGEKGKKGLRNLAEELNGVERRGEGLGRGRLGGLPPAPPPLFRRAFPPGALDACLLPFLLLPFSLLP